LKVLEEAKVKYDIFPPNTLAQARINERIDLSYMKICDYIPKCVGYPKSEMDLDQVRKLIREGLIDAVKKQLMSDVPYGVLLSGGLDSSLVTSIASKYSGQLHSFSIGLEDSPDLVAARSVAKFLGTVHHEFQFTFEEGWDAIRDVIWYTETYDITTIRASTPMYLLAKKIRELKDLNIKMILSGEGSDELFGGYLYFHKAPSPEEFHAETIRKVTDLHLYDCLRANKSTAAFGLETRPPFLDLDFVKMVLASNTKFKMFTPQQPIEKWILRSAFTNYLPEHILWRTKCQFSDSVGTSWIDGLKKYTSTLITNDQMNAAASIYPFQTPKTKEAYFYRSIFQEYFPNGIHTVPYKDSIACSTPIALSWDPQFKSKADPSGRSISDSQYLPTVATTTTTTTQIS
jgi:asparagine synthase (glutamine-hydrolysing)